MSSISTRDWFLGVRNMSWMSKFGMRTSEPAAGLSESQDEIEKAAILEKAVKGRQQTDLMLRCMLTHTSVPF